MKRKFLTALLTIAVTAGSSALHTPAAAASPVCDYNVRITGCFQPPVIVSELPIALRSRATAQIITINGQRFSAECAQLEGVNTQTLCAPVEPITSPLVVVRSVPVFTG